MRDGYTATLSASTSKPRVGDGYHQAARSAVTPPAVRERYEASPLYSHHDRPAADESTPAAKSAEGR